MREKSPVYGKIAVLITPCCDIAITLKRHFTKDTLNFANPTQLFYGLTTYECIHASFSNETNCVSVQLLLSSLCKFQHHPSWAWLVHERTTRRDLIWGNSLRAATFA